MAELVGRLRSDELVAEADGALPGEDDVRLVSLLARPVGALDEQARNGG